MSVTTQGNGSQLTVIGTEHDLLDIAIPGTFVCSIDLTPMLAGDTVELRIYKIFKTGGTRRVVYGPPYSTYVGAQPADDAGAISVPISNALTDSGSVRFTLKQTVGSVRTFDWTVEKVG